jgi:hypothetical protein
MEQTEQPGPLLLMCGNCGAKATQAHFVVKIKKLVGKKAGQV